jgi:hypothetical protein
MDAERKRLGCRLHDSIARILADPAVRLQLAGLSPEERFAREGVIVAARLDADPTTKPVLEAVTRLTKPELEAMAVEVLEEQVALGKRRRVIDPVSGQAIYLLVEGRQ